MSRPPFFDKFPTGTRQAFAAWATAWFEPYGFDCWVDVDPYRRAPKRSMDFEAPGLRRICDLACHSHDSWANVNRITVRPNASAKTSTCSVKSPTRRRARFDTHLPDRIWLAQHGQRVAIDFVDGLTGRTRELLYDCCHYGVGQPDGPSTPSPSSDLESKRSFSDGDRKTYALHPPIGEANSTWAGSSPRQRG